MRTTFRKLFIALTILYGGFSFTSCQNDTPSEDVTENRTVSRPKKIITPSQVSDLFDTPFGEDIPHIEDQFSEFVGQVHNDAVDYMLERLENLDYTIFTYSENQTDSILWALANEYFYDICSYYEIDYDNLPYLNAYDIQTFLTDSISDDLQSYIQDVIGICQSGNMNDLSYIYSSADNLLVDRERLLLKAYVSGLQHSYQYWISSDFSTFTFLPNEIMDEYTNPLDQPLFTNSPLSINWGRVRDADGQSILLGLSVTIAVHYFYYGPQFVICWTTAGTIIAINAAYQSVKAAIEISLYNNADAMNPYHPFFYDHNNCIYNYLHNQYLQYGYEYFENNWDGKFLFMIDNF